MRPYKYVPKINTGDLRNRVEIHANVSYRNELGEIGHRYQMIKTIWASIIPQTAKLQRQAAETILTNVTHKIIVRYSAAKDLDKDMHVHYKGRRYAIRYILNPYERDETLELFCEELID